MKKSGNIGNIGYNIINQSFKYNKSVVKVLPVLPSKKKCYHVLPSKSGLVTL